MLKLFARILNTFTGSLLLACIVLIVLLRLAFLAIAVLPPALGTAGVTVVLMGGIYGMLRSLDWFENMLEKQAEREAG